MIVNGTFYQRSVIINTTNQLTGSVFKAYNSFVGYLSLKKTNQELSEENARLKSLAKKSFIITDTSTFFVEDSVYLQQYQYIPAKVISSTTSKRNNYLMLNKGSRHGIGKDMAVITPAGIVGIVNEVSENFSSVISVLHSRTNISVRIIRNDQIGTMVWDGITYRVGLLLDIPGHAEIQIGDTVVTSGYSYIFPAGVMVGTIKDFEYRSGDYFYDILVDFSVDYNSMRYVDVIKNLYREEQENLKESSFVE
jgi:rod shape-determining protein MreC